MRLALITDIHGNLPALDAVLSQIQADGGVDGYLFLGDYCAMGCDPLTVLERITALPNVTFLRGNTDRYLFARDLPDPTPDDVLKDAAVISRFGETSRSFAWTQGAIAHAGWLDWMERLALEHRLTLPDGTRVLAVHASPGNDDGWGVYPTLTEAKLEAMMAEANADVLLVGHTHLPQDYALKNGRIVNPGSVGNPLAPDVRAAYAILDANESGHTIELKRAEYDTGLVLSRLKNLRHPAADLIAPFYRGIYQPFWNR